MRAALVSVTFARRRGPFFPRREWRINQLWIVVGERRRLVYQRAWMNAASPMKSAPELLGTLDAEPLHLRRDRRRAFHWALNCSSDAPPRASRLPTIIRLVPDPFHNEQSSNTSQNARRIAFALTSLRSASGSQYATMPPSARWSCISWKYSARVEVLDAGNPRAAAARRGDQVELPIAGLQEVPAVLDVHPHPRIAQRLLLFLREDDRRHRQDVARQIDEVDRLDAGSRSTPSPCCRRRIRSAAHA